MLLLTLPPKTSNGDIPDGTTVVTGQKLFNAIGNTSWIVPADVYEISAVAIGAGELGASTVGKKGGRGGDLRYINRVKVTPGETLTITIATGNTTTAGDTMILRGNEVLLRARGGSSNNVSTAIALPRIGGGNGGQPGNPTSNNASGGGGAGGYSGDGGTGANGVTSGTAGQGGAGGGGGNWYFNRSWGAGGGGVGVSGEGVNGKGGSVVQGGYTTAAAGGGGSGGSNSGNGDGATYGGGGGGASTYQGAPGAVRIIWGPDRLFPATNTVDK